MVASLMNSTWLPAWLADLQRVNEVNFKVLERNLKAYAVSVSDRFLLDQPQEQALVVAFAASTEFIERCYSKPLTITVQSLPEHQTALNAVEALIAALDGAQVRRDDLL